MRRVVLFLSIFISQVVVAENICPTNFEIPDDVRVSESHYSKENAVMALRFLDEIVTHDRLSGEWINVPNALKTLDGHIRKKNCENSKEYPKGFACENFCTFMKSSFSYD